MGASVMTMVRGTWQLSVRSLACLDLVASCVAEASACSTQGVSDLYERMSGKGASASEARPRLPQHTGLTPAATGHGGLPMENEEDDVQDIYVDQEEDEQGFVPGGDVQSLQVHTDRGEAQYRSAQLG
mgnify:CR=1 FL=1